VSLLRDTFGSKDKVDALLAPTTPGEPASPDVVETRLLERVIPTAYERRDGRRRPRYSPQYAQQALRILAQPPRHTGSAKHSCTPTCGAHGSARRPPLSPGSALSSARVRSTASTLGGHFSSGRAWSSGSAPCSSFNLAANIGQSFLTTFWLHDATRGLPFAVALWLVFGLGAAAIGTKDDGERFTTWRAVHGNLPLVFVVGLGLGWIVEAHVVATLPGTEVPVHGEVVTAGAGNGLISTIAAGTVALGFLLIPAFAPLPAREADPDPANSFGNPGRVTRLLLWAVAGPDTYRLLVHPVVLGAGERLFPAPLAIEPTSTTVFSGGAVAHVFTAHPRSS
jgi:hypothetical protein